MTNVRVCKEWYPKGSYKGQHDDGFPMNDILEEQLRILAKNIKKDWDFTIIISGSGEVRVGKSVLAMQIARYWQWLMKDLHGIEVPFDEEKNIIFEGNKLIKQGNEIGTKHPYSPLVFDEAGADLDGKKVMKGTTQQVLDYFRECGQYNMLNILVIPEFFDLPKGIAVSRSIALINVDYIIDEEGIFQRGYLYFFSRRNKKWLYMNGKKEADYAAWKPDFSGRFPNFYPIDEKKYRERKVEALKKREGSTRTKFQIHRDAAWYWLYEEYGMTMTKIAQIMEELTGVYITTMSVSNGIKHYMSEEEILKGQKQ